MAKVFPNRHKTIVDLCVIVTAMTQQQRFESTIRAHYARLCTFVRRYVESDDEAEDIVQEVFVRLWENVEQFDFADPLPYLYKSARNAVVSASRKTRVRDRWRAAAQAGPPPVAAAPDVELHHRELRKAVSAAIAALPPRCRAIFLMNRQEDLSYAEIADVLGISIKTVETQMGRALKLLRGRMAPFASALIAVVGTGLRQ
jgi:RNA polymerase sigma-70 factor (ECF subfamily)